MVTNKTCRNHLNAFDSIIESIQRSCLQKHSNTTFHDEFMQVTEAICKWEEWLTVSFLGGRFCWTSGVSKQPTSSLISIGLSGSSSIEVERYCFPWPFFCELSEPRRNAYNNSACLQNSVINYLQHENINNSLQPCYSKWKNSVLKFSTFSH